MDIGLDRRLEAWKYETVTVRVALRPSSREQREINLCNFSVCRSAARPRVTGCGCR